MPFIIEKDDDWYVSICPILDVISQGKSEKEAVDNLIEALTLFFSSCFRRGVLEEVLKDCGFNIAENKTKEIENQSFISPDNYIDAPIPFEVNTGDIPCLA